MKIFFVLGVLGLGVMGCSSQKDLGGAVMSTSSHAAFNANPVTYYQIDTVLTNVNYSNLLVGNWTIQSVRPSARNRTRHLTGAVLSLKADETFHFAMGCDTLAGRFTIDKNRISFNDVASTAGSCGNSDIDNQMINLLHLDASFYQVSNTSLLLQDGSGTGLLLATKVR